MTYQRFEELPCWQEAIRVAEMCEDFLDEVGDLIRRGKQDQLDRCSLSVSNNIAEGFERGTTNELLAFLYIARGSAGETRSMMRYFQGRPKLRKWSGLMEKIAVAAESCSRQIRAWAESLQNSDILGPRHLNDRSRTEYEKAGAQKKGQESFKQMMLKRAETMPEGPEREAWLRKWEKW